LGQNEVEIDTKAVGLNFKDVLIAMGVVDSAAISLGLEAAGIVRKVGTGVSHLQVGDRVFVFGGCCFSTRLRINAELCRRIPDVLSFQDAATMPCVFSTVIQGLQHVGRLEAGQVSDQFSDPPFQVKAHQLYSPF
jgi:NADPH:quinone reductase-like Zn-dependent oxidoreductase